MAHLPKEYKHIRAWGLMMGSFEYYIKSEQEAAAADNAPLDVIYRRAERVWHQYKDVQNENTREQIDHILRSMKG